MKKGAVARKPPAARYFGPCLSAREPTRGATKEGMTRGRKMRPAPVEVQEKVDCTKRGRTESKAVIRAAWTRQPQRAVRRRREARRVRMGGRGEGFWVRGVVSVGARLFSSLEGEGGDGGEEVWFSIGVGPDSASPSTRYLLAIFFSISKSRSRISIAITPKAR